jgi:hypothetical protein
MTSVRVQHVVLRAGGDAPSAERLARNLPQALQRALDARELQSRRDVERALRDAAREARR